MNIAIPKFEDVKTGFSSLVSGLGVIPLICIVIAIIAVLFFGIGGISNWWDSRESRKEVDAAKAESAQHLAQAEKEKEAKDQAIGLAAGYKAQADELNSTLTELKNAKPALQQQINESEKRVQAIQNSAIQPIDSNIRQRVDSLSTSLDQLYPNH